MSGPRARLDAQMPLEIQEGEPILPAAVLWALGLGEGDLLTIEESPGTGTCCFRSYLAELAGLLGLVRAPWPYVETMLRRPLAAVGPGGRLRLPAHLVDRIGGPPTLHVRYHAESLFELWLGDERRGQSCFHLEKDYTLPLLPGSRVVLPEEVLRLIGLQEEDPLRETTTLAEAHYEPSVAGRPTLQDGGFTLPAPLRLLVRDWPFDRVRLRVCLSQEGWTLRLRAWKAELDR